MTRTAHCCHSETMLGLLHLYPFLGMKGSRNSVCPLDQHVVTMENQIRPSSLGTPRKLMVWFPLQAPESLSPSSPFLTFLDPMSCEILDCVYPGKAVVALCSESVGVRA